MSIGIYFIQLFHIELHTSIKFRVLNVDKTQFCFDSVFDHLLARCTYGFESIIHYLLYFFVKINVALELWNVVNLFPQLCHGFYDEVNTISCVDA